MMSSLGEAASAAPEPTPARPVGAAAVHAQHPSPDDGPWLLVVTVQGVTDDAESEGDGRPAPSASHLKPINHRLSALGFLRARIVGGIGGERLEVVECRAGGREDTPEHELLVGFWRAFEGWKPRLVTFGGRSFGLPLLKYASMRHMLTARHLHEAGDKWSGYGHRYSQTHHIDVMDTLADFHAATFPSLAEVANALGLPHRATVERGGIVEARIRAECDAATIFLAYARWRLLTGQMTPDGHAEAAASLRAYIGSVGTLRPHLATLVT